MVIPNLYVEKVQELLAFFALAGVWVLILIGDNVTIFHLNYSTQYLDHVYVFLSLSQHEFKMFTYHGSVNYTFLCNAIYNCLYTISDRSR